MIKYSLIACVFILLGCKPPKKANLGVASKYYPPEKILKEGIVHKYHIHTYREKREDALDIQYQSLQLLADTLIEIKYNPGLQAQSFKKFYYKDNVLKMRSCKKPNRYRDTSFYEIEKADYVNWNSQTAFQPFIASEKMFNFSREYHIEQKELRDTLINGINGKIFDFDHITTIYSDTDTTVIKAKSQLVFLENMGTYSQEFQEKNLLYHYELVEQIPLKEFKLLQNHGVHDVGYIDPKTAIDPNPNFKKCKPDKITYDYYNGDPNANLQGKKGAKWKFIYELLDSEVIAGESGLLSVRFVINCKGEIGHFSIEQSDLNYQPHNFKKETIDHLLEITRKMQPWTPATIRGETQDSYAYLMYKLKDGKIIEILP